MAEPGHNGGPPLVERNFRKRWAQALFSHPKKPTGCVAMAFLIYTRMDAQGEGAVIPDVEFISACGVSDGSIRNFKRWLVDHGFIEIRLRGRRGYGSEFAARIPASIAGIHEQDYRQQVPVTATPLPAMDAGKSGLPATPAANGNIERTQAAKTELPAAIAGNFDERPSRVLDNNLNFSGGEIGRISSPPVVPPLSPTPTERSWPSGKPMFEDPYDRVKLDQAGRPILFNGLRQEWIDRFDGDEGRLELALIEIAVSLQPNSRRPLEAQVTSLLAKKLGTKKDWDKRSAARDQSRPRADAKPARELNAGEKIRAALRGGDVSAEPEFPALKTIAVEWSRS